MEIERGLTVIICLVAYMPTTKEQGCGKTVPANFPSRAF